MLKTGPSLIASLKGRTERLPCIVVDNSQHGLRLRGIFRLTMGQVVEVLPDDGAVPRDMGRRTRF